MRVRRVKVSRDQGQDKVCCRSSGRPSTLGPNYHHSGVQEVENGAGSTGSLVEDQRGSFAGMMRVSNHDIFFIITFFNNVDFVGTDLFQKFSGFAEN